MSLPLCIFAFISYWNVVLSQDPIVTIKDGQISGQMLKSSKGNEYYAFTGIPYAKPPIGELRFEPPERITPWEGVLKADPKNLSICPQMMDENESDILGGQEDCLHLNVYTPKVGQQSQLPVMVFTHGGLFKTGNGNFQRFGPQMLMDKDIVLVTFNYRLGALGFLAYPEIGFPGNSALLDQIAVLKWVQENIGDFGGNNSQVTLVGQSSGAVCVSFLMLSPLAKGLFHGAILQSGSAICPWALNNNPGQFARFLSQKFYCPTYPIESMLQCLKNQTWQNIVEKNKHFELLYGAPVFNKPNIDGNFLLDTPISLFQEGKISIDVPVILGITEKEGAKYFEKFRKIYTRIGEMHLKVDMPEILSTWYRDFSEEELKAIRQAYFQDVDINNKTQFAQAVVNVMGDVSLGCVQRTAPYLANATQYPTYVYIFTYREEYLSLASNQGKEFLGVTHGDELKYLFHMKDLTGNDSKMSEIMLSLWTNFAKFHNPTPKEDGDKLSFKWPPYESNSPKCIQLNLNPTTSNKCESEHVDLFMT